MNFWEKALIVTFIIYIVFELSLLRNPAWL